ncbi:hypothetical protein AB0B86_32635 [Micromonospora sp. NPDC049047]|uniref:hypothetical protein n=1 Tax=Micromonospora sp. NPDC049047 TaxID=3155645 RepID=UPI0033FF7C60
MAYIPNKLLGRLVGLRLYSVQFVMDYVQLRFDGELSNEVPVLNCDILPAISRADRTYLPGEPGWADALVGLIPQVVTDSCERTGTGIELRFSDAALRLHPTPKQIDTPEIAMLSGFDDGRWMVWRPGEDSFEDLT